MLCSTLLSSQSRLSIVYCMCTGGNEEEALLDFDAVQVWPDAPHMLYLASTQAPI